MISRALQSQQAAIEALTRQLSALQGDNSTTPAPGRAPAAAAPGKCKLDMSMSAFRSWRRSVLCWLHLNKWVGREALMHLRLWCEVDLQSALDAKFTTDELLMMTPSAMLDAMLELVTSSSNQAVLWDVLFSSHQSAEEPIKVYFNKCLREAIDCRFKCPTCSCDLSEYILVRKIMVGLHNPMLKRELYQSAGESITLEELKTKCLAFEAAARDSLGGKPDVFGAAVELSEDEEPPTAEDKVVTAGASKQGRGLAREGPKCRNCDRYHGQGRQACQARGLQCFKCGVKGHLARRCLKGKVKSQGEKSSLATVRVSCTGASNLPKLMVEIRASSGNWVEASAVADTGAEVCVAGTQHLRLLGLSKINLRKPNVRLVDIVGKTVPVWGMAMCGIRKGPVKCEQLIYFARSSSCIFLSLDSCKELCLIPKNFPYDTVSSVGVRCESPCTFDSVIVAEGSDRGGATGSVSVGSPPGVPSLAQGVGDVVLQCSEGGGAKGLCRALGSNHTVLAPPTSQNPPVASVTCEGGGGASGESKASRDVPAAVAPPTARRNPPFPLVEENVGRLQDWLLQRFSATTFNTSQCPLPVMRGPPHHIHVVPNAKPVAFHTPLPVPKHWETEVKKQLANDVKQGVIRKVAAGEATEWCSRMVVTSKKNGQPR